MRVKQLFQVINKILDISPQVHGEELIEQLLLAGFDLLEIHLAIELIYSSAEIIDLDVNIPTEYSWRVFNNIERTRFSLATQGYLWNLWNTGLLAINEFEAIILETLALDTMEPGIPEVNWVIRQVVNDPAKVALISGEFFTQ